MSNLKKEVLMKKLLFFAVSAIIAGVGYCTSVGEKIVAKVTNSDTQIEQQQDQTLVLEQFSDEYNLLAGHSSHVSHSSHGSHGSHVSHGSHGSHGSHTSHTSSW